MRIYKDAVGQFRPTKGGSCVCGAAIAAARENRKQGESPTQAEARRKKEISRHLMKEGLCPGSVVVNVRTGHRGVISRIDGTVVYLEGSTKKYAADVFRLADSEESVA